jgi:hypothetical protein
MKILIFIALISLLAACLEKTLFFSICFGFAYVYICSDRTSIFNEIVSINDIKQAMGSSGTALAIIFTLLYLVIVAKQARVNRSSKLIISMVVESVLLVLLGYSMLGYHNLLNLFVYQSFALFIEISIICNLVRLMYMKVRKNDSFWTKKGN